jgi:hypothetical protein
MFRFIVKLLIAGVIAHAIFRVGPPFVRYYQFRDAVQETATFADQPSFSGRKQTPEIILDRLERTAKELKVPLQREDFQLQMGKQVTVIDARYTMQLEYFPRRFYPYEFVVHAEGGPSKYRSVQP